MPLHEYKCLNCKYVGDELIRSSADIPTQCPKCNSVHYEKQLTAFAGYTGNLGPGTTPRKGAGSFKRK